MEKRLSQLALILTIVGLLVSIYMTIFKITNNAKMCIGSHGCSVVNSSRYAEVNGIPVAVLGVVGYAAILAVLLLERKPGFFQQNGSLLFFGLSLTGFLFTLYLIFVEVALIKAYCPFCITSQTAMTLIFIISVIRLVRQP
jgi:uncharacterized membrane protein